MNIPDRIKHVKQMIRHAEAHWHRQPHSVQLLAVSKGHTIKDIESAVTAGLYHFGENYLQEALVKIESLAATPIIWHFIGAIQSNKTALIAQHFSWVHGVCRKKIAQQLNDNRPALLPALNVCIQVNIDDSDSKSGIPPSQVADLATYITQLPRLNLHGLMVIPHPSLDEQQQYLTFLKAARLLQEINTQLGLTMTTLSMGMSNDLSAAIHAGSTLVRVGRAIFGERGRL